MTIILKNKDTLIFDDFKFKCSIGKKGIKTLLDIRTQSTTFEPTADNFLKTLFTPIGGFFLLIPGFITDSLGILILLPLTRIFILGLLFNSIEDFVVKELEINNQTVDLLKTRILE